MPTTDDETLDQQAGEELAGFSEEIAPELGGPPRLGELLEVLGWGAQSVGNDLADEPPVPVVFTPRWRRGAARLDPEISRVGDLSDSAFVDAGDLLSRLAHSLADSRGERPTLSDLADLVGRGLRRAGPGLIADVDPADLSGLSVSKRPGGKRPKVGDILAIPAADGQSFLAVVVARNNFGTAVGLFDGTHPAKPVSALKHPPIVRVPVYVDDAALVSGRWLIVGHDDGLRKLFPANPEIFYPPRDDRPARGPYGSAETVDGHLRQLSEQEAREVGLFDPGFTQSYLWEYLEDRLNATLRNEEETPGPKDENDAG
jgi:hypothetical protein